MVWPAEPAGAGSHSVRPGLCNTLNDVKAYKIRLTGVLTGSRSFNLGDLGRPKILQSATKYVNSRVDDGTLDPRDCSADNPMPFNWLEVIAEV